MKKFTQILLIIFLSVSVQLFTKAPLVHAQTCGQACAGGFHCDNGYDCVNGVCTSPSCPSCTYVWIFGACTAPQSCLSGSFHEGTCDSVTPLDPNDICCLPGPSCPFQGLGECSDTCTSNNDCLSGLQCNIASHQCYGTICNGGQYCPLCTGTSGLPGVCISGNVCDAKGKNSSDGNCNNPAGTVCCTNAPSSESCQLIPTPPFNEFVEFLVSIQTNTPGATYTITTSPTSCTFPSSTTVDSNGNGQFTVECAPNGSYTITATKASGRAITCNAPVTIGSIGRCDDLCSSTPSSPYGFCVQSGGGLPGCVNSGHDCSNPVADCYCCPTENGNNPTQVPRPTLSMLLCGTDSINTAIGCIPVGDKNAFLGFILRWALGISSGVSFILIIYSGFAIMTSGGDKRKLQGGKELLTAAITGLILIIFSVFILDLIGIRILRIPGL